MGRSDRFPGTGDDFLTAELNRNFLSMNVLTHEQIAKGVGLPIEKIKELAAEISSSQN